jgi:hypothetical protein
MQQATETGDEDRMMGDYSPSGKLPVSFGRSME